MTDKQKEVFSEERWTHIVKLVNELGNRINCTYFTKSELRYLIDETPLSEKQRQGAIDYYINKVKIIDLANKYGYSESQIQYYHRKIREALKKTCIRVFI